MTDKTQFQFDQLSVGVWERPAAKLAVACVVCALLFVVYLAIYLPFLPTASNTLGHDYAVHFPNLLNGYYWYLQNGLWATPWFSPSQCGGFPFFADANVLYYSATQLFIIAVSPLRAVQLTFVLFALIGTTGTFVLMRRSFQASHAAATVAAALFLFNAFFATRMLIGHLTFHSFALVPVMIAALLPSPAAQRRSVWELGARIAVAGLCLTYMFQSGMVQVIPAVLIAVGVIMLIHAFCFGFALTPFVLAVLAGLLSLAVCASRLEAEFALLSNFPRDLYPLPGIAGIGAALWSVFQTLFLDLSQRPQEVVNSQWLIDRHEWEYGVSAAPLLILAIWAVSNLLRRPWRMKLTVARMLICAAIAVLLAIPLAVNIYEPGWNAFLKGLPYFGNSSNLVRFFSAYVPVAVVVSALALDRIRFPEALAGYGATAVAAAALSLLLWQNLTTDLGYYAAQRYYPYPIEAEYERVSAARTVPAIQTIGGPADRGANPNEGLIRGQSQLYCAQTMFGYRLELFPREPLRPGPVITPIGDVINLKNPACYQYPSDNNCKPGDHFAIDSIDEAVAFMTYRPFPFAMPERQKIAGWITLASLAAVLLFLAAALVRMLVRRVMSRA